MLIWNNIFNFIVTKQWNIYCTDKYITDLKITVTDNKKKAQIVTIKNNKKKTQFFLDNKDNIVVNNNKSVNFLNKILSQYDSLKNKEQCIIKISLIYNDKSKNETEHKDLGFLEIKYDKKKPIKAILHNSKTKKNHIKSDDPKPDDPIPEDPDPIIIPDDPISDDPDPVPETDSDGPSGNDISKNMGSEVKESEKSFHSNGGNVKPKEDVPGDNDPIPNPDPDIDSEGQSHNDINKNMGSEVSELDVKVDKEDPKLDPTPPVPPKPPKPDPTDPNKPKPEINKDIGSEVNTHSEKSFHSSGGNIKPKPKDVEHDDPKQKDLVKDMGSEVGELDVKVNKEDPKLDPIPTPVPKLPEPPKPNPDPVDPNKLKPEIKKEMGEGVNDIFTQASESDDNINHDIGNNDNTDNINNKMLINVPVGEPVDDINGNSLFIKEPSIKLPRRRARSQGNINLPSLDGKCKCNHTCDKCKAGDNLNLDINKKKKDKIIKPTGNSVIGGISINPKDKNNNDPNDDTDYENKTGDGLDSDNGGGDGLDSVGPGKKKPENNTKKDTGGILNMIQEANTKKEKQAMITENKKTTEKQQKEDKKKEQKMKLINLNIPKKEKPKPPQTKPKKEENIKKPIEKPKKDSEPKKQEDVTPPKEDPEALSAMFIDQLIPIDSRSGNGKTVRIHRLSASIYNRGKETYIESGVYNMAKNRNAFSHIQQAKENIMKTAQRIFMNEQEYCSPLPFKVPNSYFANNGKIPKFPQNPILKNDFLVVKDIYNHLNDIKYSEKKKIFKPNDPQASKVELAVEGIAKIRNHRMANAITTELSQRSISLYYMIDYNHRIIHGTTSRVLPNTMIKQAISDAQYVVSTEEQAKKIQNQKNKKNKKNTKSKKNKKK